MKEFPKKIEKPFIVWIICLFLFIFILFLISFLQTSKFKELSNNSVIALIALGVVLVGAASFLIFLIKSISYFFKKGNLGKRNILIKILRVFFIILILPILLLIEFLKHSKLVELIKKKKFKEIFSKQLIKSYVFSLLIVIFLLPLWISPYLLIGYISANALGFISSPIPVGGTGSMYPTIPKGQGKTLQEQAKETVGTYGMFPYPNGLVLFGKRIFGNQVERGDIVVLRNEMLKVYNKKLLGESSGWVKRIVGIEGDVIELRGGIVYLNGQSLKEPYIAKARSTFGETFLKECSKITIPKSSIFVMGDNRKGSGDSREVGFFSFNDVKYVLSLKSQKGDLVKNWRNTSRDFDESSKIKLDRGKYLELLNEKRKEAGAKPLIYQPKLEQSAVKRGEIILKFDDFSWEATRSAYTMQRAMADVGYSNITYGEAPTQGYFEADELIDNQFQFPETKDFLLNKDYQEVGIAEVEGEINGCPTQIIIQHFAGYVPPVYKEGDIQGWGKLISNLNDVIPSWEKLKGYAGINQDDLNKLIGLMYQRKNNAEAIYYRMKANQWLTTKEQQMLDSDKSLFDQIDTLATKLNNSH